MKMSVVSSSVLILERKSVPYRNCAALMTVIPGPLAAAIRSPIAFAASLFVGILWLINILRAILAFRCLAVLAHLRAFATTAQCVARDRQSVRSPARLTIKKPCGAR